MPAGSGDSWPHDYERGRPGWPPAAIDVLHLPRSATVLDLGAGTGKLTRDLLDAFDSVIAVEPADAMRRVLSNLFPGCDARAGDARALPVADASVDAIFAAQSFHWFNDLESLAEIARVLRPGGVLELLWNVPAEPWKPSTETVEARLRDVMPDQEVSYDPLDLGHPRGDWSRNFGRAGFEPYEHTTAPNPQTLDRDGLVAYYASMGWLADLPDDQRLALLAEVRSLLTSSEYEREWTTHIYWTRLRR
jgi:SAM-dependent methyltransferase